MSENLPGPGETIIDGADDVEDAGFIDITPEEAEAERRARGSQTYRRGRSSLRPILLMLSLFGGILLLFSSTSDWFVDDGGLGGSGTGTEGHFVLTGGGTVVNRTTGGPFPIKVGAGKTTWVNDPARAGTCYTLPLMPDGSGRKVFRTISDNGYVRVTEPQPWVEDGMVASVSYGKGCKS